MAFHNSVTTSQKTHDGYITETNPLKGFKGNYSCLLWELHGTHNQSTPCGKKYGFILKCLLHIMSGVI
jgi:hypothetical protein